jgi:hypothetical protein
MKKRQHSRRPGRGRAYGFMVKTSDNLLAVTRGAWATRARARKNYVASLAAPITWRQCYRLGCRVVTVDIKEII